MLGLLTNLASALQSKIIIGLVAVMIVSAGGGILYFKFSQSKIDTLNKNVATLEAGMVTLKTEISKQNESILLLDEQRENDQQTVIYMADAHAETQAEVNRLSKQFKGHNMTNLTRKKPVLIERIINRGTDKVFDEFENISDPTTYKRNE